MQIDPELREAQEKAMINIGLGALLKMDAERSTEDDEEIEVD
jgi:hypothetical protein